jgi:hypothetical protein
MTVLSLPATRIFLVAVASTAIACQLVPLAAQQTQKKSHKSNASQDLRKLGEAIAKAVLEKNIQTLLSYDRADLRSLDEAALKNNESDLYCYIFDSDCITWGDGTWRSVYNKLSQAHQLEIKVIMARSPYDRQLYGSLFFYNDDGAISEKDLRSQDFLCKEAPARIASWKFRLENGKWKPVTPLFDSETRGPCPSDAQQHE